MCDECVPRAARRQVHGTLLHGKTEMRKRGRVRERDGWVRERDGEREEEREKERTSSWNDEPS